MPTNLIRPVDADVDRYALVEDADLKELDELYLLLSHAKALENELKQVLGPDRWRLVDSALSGSVHVHKLDYQSRRDVFIQSTTELQNTRDYEIGSVLENKRWAIRFLILTTLLMIINITYIGIAIFGSVEQSASARQMILPNAAFLLSNGIMTLSNASRLSQKSDRVQKVLVSNLDSVHQHALDLAASRD